LVDDSIVRGTSSIILTKMLREAGAKEIHMRISSPPVRYPCHFGINTPTQRLLIGANKNVEEVRARLGLDTLAYLPLGLLKGVVGDCINYCSACFDGKYLMPLEKCRRIGRIEPEKIKPQS
jgi:amidophosphoribosyltransferase